MADQVLTYSDNTTVAKNTVAWLNHLRDYGCLTEADMASITTYAQMRAAIVLHVPPAVNAESESIVREGLKTLDRAKQVGAITDAFVSTASGQSSGSRIPNLLTAIAALTAPDTVPSTFSNSFAFQA
jgi:hypothetical protein